MLSCFFIASEILKCLVVALRHIDLSTDDNQLTDTNNPKDINAHMQMNEETMETKQQPNAINTHKNIDTQNLDELTDNTTIDMHEQTSNAIHTDQNPFISNTNDQHTHSDNNTIRPNLTPQPNTDNPLRNTHTVHDFLNI